MEDTEVRITAPNAAASSTAASSPGNGPAPDSKEARASPSAQSKHSRLRRRSRRESKQSSAARTTGAPGHATSTSTSTSASPTAAATAADADTDVAMVVDSEVLGAVTSTSQAVLDADHRLALDLMEQERMESERTRKAAGGKRSRARSTSAADGDGDGDADATRNESKRRVVRSRPTRVSADTDAVGDADDDDGDTEWKLPAGTKAPVTPPRRRTRSSRSAAVANGGSAGAAANRSAAAPASSAAGTTPSIGAGRDGSSRASAIELVGDAEDDAMAAAAVASAGAEAEAGAAGAAGGVANGVGPGGLRRAEQMQLVPRANERPRTAAQRLNLILRGTEHIGKTTKEQRQTLDKYGLMQRNMEIQAEMLWLDGEYEKTLPDYDQHAPNWQELTKGVDAVMDSLADEADEIEHLLVENFGLEGAGRFLCDDSVLEAYEIGSALGRHSSDRAQRDPRPLRGGTADTAAAPDANTAAATEDESDEPRASAHVLPEVFGAPDPMDQMVAERKLTKSEREIQEKLDREADEIKRRRLERAEKQKNSLLGRLLDYFDKHIDVMADAQEKAQTEFDAEADEEGHESDDGLDLSQKRRGPRKRFGVKFAVPIQLSTLDSARFAAALPAPLPAAPTHAVGSPASPPAPDAASEPMAIELTAESALDNSKPDKEEKAIAAPAAAPATGAGSSAATPSTQPLEDGDASTEAVATCTIALPVITMQCIPPSRVPPPPASRMQAAGVRAASDAPTARTASTLSSSDSTASGAAASLGSVAAPAAAPLNLVTVRRRATVIPSTAEPATSSAVPAGSGAASSSSPPATSSSSSSEAPAAAARANDPFAALFYGDTLADDESETAAAAAASIAEEGAVAVGPSLVPAISARSCTCYEASTLPRAAADFIAFCPLHSHVTLHRSDGTWLGLIWRNRTINALRTLLSAGLCVLHVNIANATSAAADSAPTSGSSSTAAGAPFLVQFRALLSTRLFERHLLYTNPLRLAMLTLLRKSRPEAGNASSNPIDDHIDRDGGDRGSSAAASLVKASPLKRKRSQPIPASPSRPSGDRMNAVPEGMMNGTSHAAAESADELSGGLKRRKTEAVPSASDVRGMPTGAAATTPSSMPVAAAPNGSGKAEKEEKAVTRADSLANGAAGAVGVAKITALPEVPDVESVTSTIDENGHIQYVTGSGAAANPFLDPLETDNAIEVVPEDEGEGDDADGDGEDDGAVDGRGDRIEAEDDGEAEADSEQTRKWSKTDLDALYESIRPTPKWQTECKEPAGLKCTLRAYQRKALAWMHARERVHEQFSNPLWEKFRLGDGRDVFFNAHSGELTLEPPTAVRDVSGGILAEEMGLGKSVEMIALMLLHRSKVGRSHTTPIRFKFEGQTCRQDSIVLPAECSDALMRAPATLIVSPMSIVYQWKSEIQKHAPSLKVLIYDGKRRAKKVPTYEEMANYDVVLTTYNILSEEVNYNKTMPYTLRGEKRYAIPETPLLQIHWWRVILDEAQNVKSSVRSSARMARRIDATHRWCVSGTPIGRRGLDDLYGLMLFLRLQPYDQYHWWSKTIRLSLADGLDRLQQLLRRVMWRHSKRHVVAEIRLPPLVQNTHYLTFSPIEEEYYKRFLLDIQSKVYQQSSKGTLDDVEAVYKLEELRQACCHPQVARESFLGNRILKMTEIAEKMSKRAKDEQATSERELCRELNRLGQLYRFHGDMVRAEKVFVEAWRIADSGIDSSLSLASEKKADDLEIAKNIVTENVQVRAWRAIELVTCFYLAKIYREKLDEIEKAAGITGPSASASASGSGAAAPSGIATDEKIAVGAHSAMPRTTPIVTMDLTDDKPVGGSGSESVAAASASLTPETTAELRKRYEKMQRQHESVKHELVEMLERKVADQHGLITKYEKLLVDFTMGNRKGLDESVTAIVGQRAKVGVDKFNDDKQPYMKMIATIESRLTEQKTALNKAYHYARWHADHREIAALCEIFETPRWSRQKAACLKMIVENVPRAKAVDELPRGVSANALNASDHFTLPLLFKAGAVRPGESSSPAPSDEVVAAQSRLPAETYLTRYRDKVSRKLVTLQRELDAQSARRDLASEKGFWQVKSEWERVTDSLTVCRILREIKKDAVVLRDVSEQLKVEMENLELSLVPPVFDPSEKDKDIKALLASTERLKVQSINKQRHLTYLRRRFAANQSADEMFGESGVAECAICRSELLHAVVTLCGHFFCAECILPWIKRHGHCPNCRAELMEGQVFQVNAQLPRRSAQSASGAAADQKSAPSSSAGAGSSASAGPANIKGEGEFGTKVEAMVKKIVALNRADPTVKSLVFSQFSRMLELIARALSVNGVSYIHLSGTVRERAKQIQSFQSDANVKVLLMSLRNDNSGLTLVSATHVFLAEPSLNMAVEAQAINRVHRIGQLKKTFVHKFVMRHSIEQKIVDMQSRQSRGRSQIGSIIAAGAAALSQREKEEIHVADLLSFLDLSNQNGKFGWLKAQAPSIADALNRIATNSGH